MNQLEEGTALTLDFSKLRQLSERDQSVIPVVLQHADTQEVLYVAYANELALQETLKTGRAVLWSTSRNELWRKGESSGDILELVDVRVNCEQNSLLYVVRPHGGCCHTKDADGNTRPTCYYRTISADSGEMVFNQP
jgi:phosphoribosyl-AMP cyclohydrolase